MYFYRLRKSLFSKFGYILLLGFVLRSFWAFFVDVQPISDSLVYDQLAERIASGHGYSWPTGASTAYWPVGTSAFYAAVYVLFGHDLRLVAAINVVMGTLLIAATYLLARTHFERPPALMAALLIAIWPTWIAFTTVISSELPSTLIFTAALAVAFSRIGSEGARTALSSALFVISAYFRANLLPFVLIVPALGAILRRSWRYLIVHGALAAVVAGSLIAPWSIRNYRELGVHVTISTNFGVNLWIGNNPQATGGYMAPPPIGVYPMPENEVLQDELYRVSALKFIRENPEQYVLLSLNRIRQTYDRETFGVAWNERGLAEGAKLPLKLAMTGYWLVILATSLIGAALFLWRRPGQLLSPFVLVPAALSATPILIMASERFHYGLAPFIAIFAGYALVRLRLKRQARLVSSNEQRVKVPNGG